MNPSVVDAPGMGADETATLEAAPEPMPVADGPAAVVAAASCVEPAVLAEAGADAGPQNAAKQAPAVAATEAAEVSGSDEISPTEDAHALPPGTAGEPGMSPAECGAELAERFPALFAGTPKPVKLRIHADIQLRAPGVFTRRTLSFFFSRYTTTTAYLKSLLAHQQRFDLDGQACGDISPEHHSAAQAELARRKKVFDERRAAERAMHEARGARGSRATGARNAAGPRGPQAASAPGEAGRQPKHAARAGSPGTPGPASTEGSPAPRLSAAQTRLAADAGRRADAARSRTGSHAVPPRPNRATSPALPAAAAQPAGTGDAERDARLQLLRAWNSSPLTKANFCVLKRITPAELDAAIALEKQQHMPAGAA